MPNYMDTIRAREAAFVPTIKDASASDWEKALLYRAGHLSLRKVPERLRAVAVAPMRRFTQEFLYSAGGVANPEEADAFLFESLCRTIDPMPGRVRASSGGAVAPAVFANTVNIVCHEYVKNTPDSLEGIRVIDELDCFLPAQILQAIDAQHVQLLAKGGTAAHAQFLIADAGTRKLARVALRGEVDEQNWFDDASGALWKSFGQMSRAAIRGSHDLDWSQILSNPVLEQTGERIFSVAHGNLGTAALSDTAIAAGCAAIRKQVVTSPDGQTQHLNLQPRYIITSPDLEGTARKALRLLQNDRPDFDLELRLESRLADLPTTNPLTGQTVRGNGTNWLLSCDATNAPWLARGILQGQFEPRVRVGSLEPSDNAGRYGLLIDVNFDISSSLIDFRGVYFSTGAGA